MDMLNIDQIIQLREEAIQKLVDQKIQLQTELETITARISEIENQLLKLGYQQARRHSPTNRASRGTGKLYEYRDGQGFLLVETGELIGPGATRK